MGPGYSKTLFSIPVSTSDICSLLTLMGVWFRTSSLVGSLYGTLKGAHNVGIKTHPNIIIAKNFCIYEIEYELLNHYF